MDRFGLQTSPRAGRGDTGEGDCGDYPSDNESEAKMIETWLKGSGPTEMNSCHMVISSVGWAVTEALAAWFCGTFANPGLG